MGDCCSRSVVPLQNSQHNKQSVKCVSWGWPLIFLNCPLNYSQHDPDTSVTSSTHILDAQQIFLPRQVYFFVEELLKRYFIVCCKDVIGLQLVCSLNRCSDNYMSLFSIWAPYSFPGWLLYLGGIGWSCSKNNICGKMDFWFISLCKLRVAVCSEKDRSFLSSRAKKEQRKVAKSVHRVIFT